jgi:hypothetical protein
LPLLLQAHERPQSPPSQVIWIVITKERGDDGRIKIGMSKSPDNRYKIRQSGTPRGIRMTDNPRAFDLIYMFLADPGMTDKDYHRDPLIAGSRIDARQEFFFDNKWVRFWIERQRARTDEVDNHV